MGAAPSQRRLLDSGRSRLGTAIPALAPSLCETWTISLLRQSICPTLADALKAHCCLQQDTQQWRDCHALPVLISQKNVAALHNKVAGANNGLNQIDILLNISYLLIFRVYDA